jgi:hypothetical protein
MTNDAAAATRIIKLTERQRSQFMQRAAAIIDSYPGPMPFDAAIQAEDAINQASTCDMRIARYRRILEEQQASSGA